MGNQIQLGDTVLHEMSGFKGTVAAKTAYISGKIRYLVISKVKKSGDVKNYWFDREDLVVTNNDN